MVLTFIGASLLWVGWFGFNAGSAVSAGMQAGLAMTGAHMATATAAFTWMLVEGVMRGKPTRGGICPRAGARPLPLTPAAGLRWPARLAVHRHRRRRPLLLGLHRLEAHARLR